MRRLATLRHPDTPRSGSELHRLAVRSDAALELLRRVDGSTLRGSPRDLVVLEHLVAEGP